MSVIERLGPILKRGIRRSKVPGASLAVLHAGDVHTVSAGFANVDTGVPVTDDTLFQIGSITKIFTTTLIMQLVDEGVIDLDAPVKTYLPEFRVGDANAEESVTIRHLLSHTSGIDGDLFMDSGRGDGAVMRLLDMASLAPSLFPPGERMSYCNIGFAILGQVIARLRRSTWDDQIAAHIFEPLGLRHALTHPEDVLRFRCAMGHLPGSGGTVRTAPEAWLSTGQRAAGATPMLSAADVMTFARAHMANGRIPDTARGRILSARSARQMRRRQIPVPGGARAVNGWGLGWILMDWNGTPVFGHDGATLGQASFLRVEPRSGAAMVLLTNGGRDPGGLHEWLAAQVFDELAGTHEPPMPALNPALEVDLDAFVGVYSNLSADITIARKDGGLVISSVPKSRPMLGGPMDEVPMGLLDGSSARLNTGRELIDRTHYQFSARTDGRYQFVGTGMRLFRRLA